MFISLAVGTATVWSKIHSTRDEAISKLRESNAIGHECYLISDGRARRIRFKKRAPLAPLGPRDLRNLFAGIVGQAVFHEKYAKPFISHKLMRVDSKSCIMGRLICSTTVKGAMVIMDYLKREVK